MYLFVKIMFQASLLTFLINLNSFAYDSNDLSNLLETKICLRCELSNADLRNQNLENAVLRGSNLSRSKLNGADLTNSDLNGANLKGADLSKAILLNSDINWILKDNTTKMCKTTMPDGTINNNC